jgi:hypothetical protein
MTQEDAYVHLAYIVIEAIFLVYYCLMGGGPRTHWQGIPTYAGAIGSNKSEHCSVVEK